MGGARDPGLKEQKLSSANSSGLKGCEFVISWRGSLGHGICAAQRTD